jgi:hypothetical protein
MKCLFYRFIFLTVIFFDLKLKCFSLNKNITDFLQDRIEKYGKQLVKEMENSFSTICSFDGCVCSYHSCALPLPLDCHHRWNKNCTFCGSMVNLNYGGLLVGNRFYNVNTDNDEIREVLCSSQRLEPLMEKIVMGEDMIVRILAGTYNGVLRNWPCEPVCQKYDTRYRPWYVSATSGVKDILFIIDASNNISVENLEKIKQFVAFILESLTFNDYAAVTTIGNEDKEFSPYLLRADQAGGGYINNFLKALESKDPSNYELAFAKAFDILDRSIDTDRTANCQRVIIFISGGTPENGLTDHEKLLKHIDDLENTGNNFFFTYSIGEKVDPFLKKLACHKSGIYEHIGEDYYSATLSYFHILASSLKTSSITYAEPYEDALGSGYMTTASLPVYDTSVDPPFIIGVFGFDILMTDLIKIGRIDEIYLAFQEIGSALCSKVELSRCQVESVRNHKCGLIETDCNQIKTSIRKCPDKTLIDRTLCNYDIKSSLNQCCTKNLCSLAPFIILGLVLGIVFIIITVFLVIYICFKNIWNYICCKKCHLKISDFDTIDNNESKNIMRGSNKELNILDAKKYMEK